MKIGFSFGRCIRDIVTGVVPLDDVICIISRTRFTTIDHMYEVCHDYAYDSFHGLDIDECKVVAEALYRSGKIHQPRIYGKSPGGVIDQYIWMDLVPTVTDMNPSLHEAWEHYRLLLTLGASEPIPDGEYAPTN